MTENAAHRQGTMRMIECLAIPSVLFLVAAAWFHEARDFSSTVRVAPLAITAPVLFLSIVVLVLVQKIVGVRQQRPTRSLVDSYLDTH